ncbi:MAG: bifunctional lysylphosphatidylglycerol flippase/synthetase MprF [Cellulosilyticaceae bacterium]
MQKKIGALVKNNTKLLIYQSFWIGLILMALYLLKKPLDTTHLPTLLESISAQSRSQMVTCTILGLIAVSSLCVFDFILSKKLELDVAPLEIFKIAWISHTAGNFMVDVGSKHSGIRYFLYKFQGVGNKKATLMNIIKNSLFISSTDDTAIDVDINTRLTLMVSLLLRWGIASVFFSYLIQLYSPTTSSLTVIMVYLIAVLLGTLSKLPSGMGVFETTCLVGLYTIGVPLEHAVVTIILYRIYYSLLPWLISMVLLTWQIINYKNIKLAASKKRIIQSLGVHALAALMFFTGLFILVTTYLPEFQNSSSGYTQLIYMGIGLITLILSKSVYDKVSSAYFMTLCTLILTITYSLIKQFNIIEVTFLSLLFVLIYCSKSCFYRKAAPLKLMFFINRFICLTVISLMYLWIYQQILVDNNIPVYINLKEPGYLITLGVILLVGSLLMCAVKVDKPLFFEPTDNDLAELSQFLQKYEGNSMTHLLFLKDKNLFYAKDKNVLIGFRPYKDKLIALGDPIGDSRYFNEAINEFRVYAHQFDMTPLFYEVSDKFLPLYHENGFKFLKLGEEAVVHLKDFTLIGKRGAALRTIKNKMDRGELEFELLSTPIPNEIMDELEHISDSWLEGRKEKGFSLGFFDREYINRAPVGIVKKDGQIVGFTTILPHYSNHTVSIDLMRLIPHPPNGAMDALFIGILLWSIEQGYEKFIVGKAPLSNVGTHKFCSPSEKIAKYIYEYGNRVYSFKGLRRYKEKFYPEWEGTYLAYPKGTNLSVTILNLTRLISGSDDTKG